MSIMLEEEINNYSLVAALQTTLPPVPNQTAPQVPPFITPSPTISTAATNVRKIAAAFPDLSTKVQLNSILNRK